MKMVVRYIEDSEEFISEWRDWERISGRVDDGKVIFSSTALKYIWDMLDSCYSSDATVSWDPVAICCEFNEYESFREMVRDYEPQGRNDRVRDFVMENEGEYSRLPGGSYIKTIC